MNKGIDIDRYTRAPHLLAELCRDVIARMDVALPRSCENSDSVEMEAQLCEIAKTIERLEKMNVAIPDVLRAEKTRLAASFAVKDETTQVLEELADTLGILLRDIRAILLRRKPQSSSSGSNTMRVNPDRIPRSVLRASILGTLKALGGSAPKARVLELVEVELQGKFLPADLVWSDAMKMYSGQNATAKLRSELIEQGLVRGDSKLGIWELSEFSE